MKNPEEAKKFEKIVGTFFYSLFGQMKATHPRSELVKIFGESNLTEMEIALYAKRKKEKVL